MSTDKGSSASTSNRLRRESVIPTLGHTSSQSISATTAAAAAAAAQRQDIQHRRRMSVNTLGLGFNGTGGNGGQSPAMNSPWTRRASVSSSLGSDENAFEECADSFTFPPHTPLTRRFSTGAQALRNNARSVPGGAASPNGSLIAPVRAKSGAINFSTSPPVFKGRDGFNFADNFRSRAERASMSSAGGMPSYPSFPLRRRTGSMALAPTELPQVQQPQARPVPPPPQKSKGLTDPIQERILKGDFYMD